MIANSDENVYVVGECGSYFDASTAYVEVWSAKGEAYAEQTGEPVDCDAAVKRAISVVDLIRFWQKFNGPLPMNDKYDPEYDPERG